MFFLTVHKIHESPCNGKYGYWSYVLELHYPSSLANKKQTAPVINGKTLLLHILYNNG